MPFSNQAAQTDNSLIQTGEEKKKKLVNSTAREFLAILFGKEEPPEINTVKKTVKLNRFNLSKYMMGYESSESDDEKENYEDIFCKKLEWQNYVDRFLLLTPLNPKDEDDEPTWERCLEVYDEEIERRCAQLGNEYDSGS